MWLVRTHVGTKHQLLLRWSKPRWHYVIVVDASPRARTAASNVVANGVYYRLVVLCVSGLLFL
jgi:hypothetical protein